MFCQNCGTQNAEGIKFCSNCGAPLQSAAQETTVLNQPPVQTQTYSGQANSGAQYQMPPVQPQPPKKNKNGLIIGIAAGAVALIAIVAVVLIVVLGGKDKDETSDADKPSVKQEEVQKPTENPTEKLTEKPTETKQELSYKETAIAFLKAVYEGNYAEAQKYCIVDIPGEFDNLGNKLVPSEMQELYADLEEIANEEWGVEGSVNSMKDFYKLAGKMAKEQIDYTIADIKVTDAEPIDLSDSYNKEDLIDDIIDCDFTDELITEETYSNFVDINNISEAYKVELTSTAKFNDGSTQNADSWFYVVKYNGEWRVVMDPIADLMS